MPKRRRRGLALVICLLVAFLNGVLSCIYAADGLRVTVSPGEDVYSAVGMDVDWSRDEDGYFCASCRGSRKALKLRVSKDGVTYTYDLRGDGEYDVYPLQMGSGRYTLTLYEWISGNNYRQLSSLTLRAELGSEDIYSLYPNQYVWYDANTNAVAISDEICADAQTDRERFDAIWDYVTSHMVYNYIKALTVQKQKGYLPDVDEVLEEGMGICFDFAAVMACMLRAQGVRAQLVVGQADDMSHAWNNVYLDGEWVRFDATSAVTNTKISVYTEEWRY